MSGGNIVTFSLLLFFCFCLVPIFPKLRKQSLELNAFNQLQQYPGSPKSLLALVWELLFFINDPVLTYFLLHVRKQV